MKKTLLTLSIAAVFAVGASAAEFKAGTYTAKAPGIHGDVTVTVTFTKDKIADVKVTHLKPRASAPRPLSCSRAAS